LPSPAGSWARRAAASLSIIFVIGVSGCSRRTVGAWVPTGTFYAGKAAAWTTSDAPIWVVGEGAQVFRIDDDELEPEQEADALLTDGDRLRTIWGTSASDVWVHACLHYDGSGWRRSPPIDLPPKPPGSTGPAGPTTVNECTGSAVHGSAPGHYRLAFTSASTWDVELAQGGWVFGPLPPLPKVINNRDTPAALHGTAVDDVHLVGANRALHFDGEWRALQVDEAHVLYSVWARTRTEAYAVGERWVLPAGAVLLRYDGAIWSAIPGPPGETYRWVSGRGADELLVATDRIVYQRQPDGTWTELIAPPEERSEILCLHRAEDVVVVCVRNYNDQRVTIWIKR